MTLRNDILTELLALSPFLATVERGNPFRVPGGYFTQLAQTTLENALEDDELRTSAPVTMNLRTTGSNMSVPEGYFEELFHNTMAQLHEDAEITAKLPDTATPFTTPANYFEQLQANILLAVKDAAHDEELNTQFLQDAIAGEGFTVPPQFFEQMQAAVRNRLENLANEETGFDTGNIDQIAVEPAFAIPTNYFEELQENVRVAVGEEEYMPELLAQLPVNAGFTTPNGYFEQLHQHVMKAVGTQDVIAAPETGKTVPISPAQRQSNTGFRYVLRVAAVLAVLFVGWQLLNLPSQQGNGQQTALLNPPSPQLLLKMEKMKTDLGLTDGDLTAYISNNAEDFEAIIDEKIGDNDIPAQPQMTKSIKLNLEAMDWLDISTDEIK
ncbi:hypothetical protein C7N43_22810 [Sphingobacteriales bacterium UPWRP_1]|nr:hypothetical protein B6N25_14865 [Sphingobacteriales bacterium TSM_CSS]PSJ74673.1 hypothetical protein C7N43_22810 [Sphingobacteriales bacterium UPWRP_1]